MNKLIDTIIKVLVACFYSIYLPAFSEETKVDQYNNILGDAAAVERSRLSYNDKDNLAVIRVQEMTYIISSSIINGDFFRYATEGTDLAADRPISVMDLLYMYDSAAATPYDSLINGALLRDKVSLSRDDLNRKFLEKIIAITIQCYADGVPEDIQANIQSIIDAGYDAAPGVFLRTDNGLEGIQQQRLDALKNAIVDFLYRLRKYTNDTAFVPDANRDRDRAVANTNHLETDKRNLTKLEAPLGVIELLLARVNRPATIDSVVSTLKCLCSSISSPWCTNVPRLRGLGIPDLPGRLNALSNISQVTGAIFHTEQMVDWLSSKFGGNILVKISGKAPCLKCSHYIQYATTTIGRRIRDDWDDRTIIGFKDGLGSRDSWDNHRYPIKVFHAAPELNIKVKKFQPDVDAPLFPQIPGTYDATDFDEGGVFGISKSTCFAIGKIDGDPGNEEETHYKGQLQMQESGSVIQIQDVREAEEPVLKSVGP